MKSDLTDFDESVEEFRAFLASQGHSDKVIWVFRDDVWFRDKHRVAIRVPLSSKNEALIRRVYLDGKVKGLACLFALARFGDSTVATVWFPKYEHEEVQGWDIGIKFSIRTPLFEASSIGRIAWNFVRLLPSFKRSFRDNASWIGSREWARS